MTTSNALGQMHVVPALLEFMRRHPQVEIDLTITDGIVDLLRERMDIAIRSAKLPDSSLMSRKLITNRRIVCAAPSYLDRHGRPQRPRDLADHRCMRLNLPGAFNDWGLQWEGGQRHELGRGFACNSLETLHTACRAGHGIAWLPMFLVAQDIDAGLLVPLLDEYRDPESDTSISIVRPEMDLVPRRIRALVDFLVDHFRQLVL